MAVKLRLARHGAKKRPYYRIVAADVRAPRDGRFIEQVGAYNPMLPKDSEDRVNSTLKKFNLGSKKARAQQTALHVSLALLAFGNGKLAITQIKVSRARKR